MKRKIAVLVRDRQEEALRMASGMVLLDDQIDVYVLDRGIEASKNNQLYLVTLQEMECALYTNCRQNDGMCHLPIQEIAGRLPSYDHVLAY